MVIHSRSGIRDQSVTTAPRRALVTSHFITGTSAYISRLEWARGDLPTAYWDVAQPNEPAWVTSLPTSWPTSHPEASV